MADLVLSTVTDGVAVITLNRPEKRNAMSDGMRAAFQTALEAAASDRFVRALVLTGAGGAFCAGGDVARMEAPQGEVAFNGWLRQGGVHRVQTLLHTLPKPTVAAVDGAAAGLGADTALALARTLSGGSAKGLLNQSFESPVAAIFNSGSQAQGICYTSSEHRASVAAFLDRKSA